MKTLGLVAVMTLAWTAGAGAADIQGKWGIGAGVFGRGGEVSLIRGRSERSAWLFDLQVSGATNDRHVDFDAQGIPAATVNSNQIVIAAGPGLRRFTRPEADLSPYLDFSIHGIYGRLHNSGLFTDTGWGMGAALRFGVEYMTRRHVSLAFHTSAVDLSWLRTRTTSFGSVTHVTQVAAAMGVQPVLYVRAYF